MWVSHVFILFALPALIACSVVPDSGPSRRDVEAKATVALARTDAAAVLNYALLDLNRSVLPYLDDPGPGSLYRTFGDCYGYLLLASGWADVVVDPIMNPWDLLPLIPCIVGAGGKITDWQGNDASRPEANSIVACAAELHDEVIRLLNP